MSRHQETKDQQDNLSLDEEREYLLNAKEEEGTITKEEKGELLGLRCYPGNPRGQELRKKEHLGNITVEEEGELYGLRCYPDNPRGQELRKKEHVGNITEEEKEELFALNKEKHWNEEMSAQLRELLKRSESKDPNVEMVSMNQGGIIEVGRDDKEEKVIWTFGLGGCFGTVVFTENARGFKTAILTHFDPTNVALNISKLKELVDSNPGMKKSECKQSVLVFGIEGDYEGSHENGPAADGLACKEGALEIANAIQNELGPDIEVKFNTYPGSQAIGEIDFGTLVVRIPPKGQATYKTWFSAGKLGMAKEDRVAQLKEKIKKGVNYIRQKL